MELRPIITVVFVLSLLSAVYCDKGAEESVRVKRIVNGVRAQARDHPYSVFIYWYLDRPGRYTFRFKCSGTLIGRQWALTAANCFQDLITAQGKKDNETMILDTHNSVTLRAGVVSAWDVLPPEDYPNLQDRFADQIYIHTSYTKPSAKYDVDIALIYTEAMFRIPTVPYNYVTYAEIAANFPENGFRLKSDYGGCYVVGWGLSDNSHQLTDVGVGDWGSGTIRFSLSSGVLAPQYLKSIHVDAGGVKACRHMQQWLNYRNTEDVDPYYICAKSPNKTHPQNTCWGDNGAALMCDGLLCGVLSQRRESAPCAGPQSYSYFTSVGHPEVFNWIKRYVKEVMPLLHPAPRMSDLERFPT